MISLISRWKLKNGCPAELLHALKRVAAEVKASEPDTLLYSVHLTAQSPLNASRQPIEPPVAPVALEEQAEVVFFEVYRDADAFARHVNGEVFTRFREDNIRYFYEDSANPGWPNTVTEFLDRKSAFFRMKAAGCQPG
jgi:hypothetical protein